jgi:cytochrome c553
MTAKSHHYGVRSGVPVITVSMNTHETRTSRVKAKRESLPRLSVPAEADVVEQLKALAAKHRRSVASEALVAIEEHIERHREECRKG